MDTTADTLRSVAVASQKADVTEPWMSVDEVAAHLCVAKDSVYRWTDAKRLGAHKIGKLWRFKLSQVEEWTRGGGANERKAKRRSLKR